MNINGIVRGKMILPLLGKHSFTSVIQHHIKIFLPSYVKKSLTFATKYEHIILYHCTQVNEYCWSST